MTIKNELIQKDTDYLWHALTHYKKSEGYKPKIYTHGEGVRLFDIDGNSYIDGVSGLWCVNVGYGQEKLNQAAYNQLQRLPYYPLMASHIPAIELSEKLNQGLGYKAKVHYSNSGSEANEVALKIARQYQSQKPNGQFRYKFISRYRAYHGSTLGTLSATATAGRKYRYEPLLPGFIHINPPYCYRCPYGKEHPHCNLECAEELARVINYEGADTIAGFIAEPIMAAGGVIVPPDEYLPKVAEICKEAGILFILDEVVTGFGRTGKMFGHQHWNIKPDIISFAKGITSGYLPLSATAVREEIFNGFLSDEDEGSSFRHVNTFGGNPASCAVALANIELLNELDLIQKAQSQGNYFLDLLSELKDLPVVGDVRGKGLFIGIEIVTDKKLKTPIAEGYLTQLIKKANAKGVIIGKNTSSVPNYSNVLIIAPPLIVEKSDLLTISRTLKQLLEELAQEITGR